MAAAPPIPKPPNELLPGLQGLGQLYGYIQKLYSSLVSTYRITTRLNALAVLTPLTQTISDPPTKAEVEALQAKINAIITAAQ